MGFGGEFVSEVSERVFDGPEGLVLGQVHEFVGHAFEDGVGIAAQCGEDLLTTLLTLRSGLVRGRSGFVQHENLPGVKSTVP